MLRPTAHGVGLASTRLDQVRTGTPCWSLFPPLSNDLAELGYFRDCFPASLHQAASLHSETATVSLDGHCLRQTDTVRGLQKDGLRLQGGVANVQRKSQRTQAVPQVFFPVLQCLGVAHLDCSTISYVFGPETHVLFIFLYSLSRNLSRSLWRWRET